MFTYSNEFLVTVGYRGSDNRGSTVIILYLLQGINILVTLTQKILEECEKKNLRIKIGGQWMVLG